MFDSTLDLFLESTNPMSNEMLVEGFGNSYSPDMEGIEEIRGENLRESFLLESAILKASTQTTKHTKAGNLSEATALQEAVLSNVFGKIKALIQKMWKRIKDFFGSVKLFFNKLASKESTFASKYKSEIQAISSVEIEGYNFKPDAITVVGCWSKAEALINDQFKAVDACASAVVSASDAEAANAKIKSAKENMLDTAKLKDKVANAITNGGTVSSFKKDVFGLLGMDKTATVKYTGSQLYSILSTLNNSLNAVSADEKAADKAYNKAIQIVDTLAKKVSGDAGDKGSAYNTVKSMASSVAGQAKELLDFVNSVAGARATVYKKQAGQAKKAAYKGIAGAKKDDRAAANKGLGESTDFSNLYAELIGE